MKSPVDVWGIESAGVRRIRRPLLALIALIVALAVGYAVNAIRGADAPAPHPTPSSTTSAPAPFAGPTSAVLISTLSDV
jgi:hypothetical protein